MSGSIADSAYTIPRAFAVIGAHTANNNLAGAVALTPPAGANAVLLQAITQNVRYTLDNSAPTATVGFQLRSSDPPLIIDIGPGMTIQAIQETATAVLQIQWGKYI